MNRFFIIVFSLLFGIQNADANEKAKPQPLDSLQDRSLRTSDLIFLGKLTKADTVLCTMSFNVIEVFKGNPAQKELEIIWDKHTQIINLDKSLWIVYANQRSDSTLVLNVNGLTRSNIHPETAWTYILPPPPQENIDQIEFIYYNNLWIDYKLNAYKDWQEELELLRRNKESDSKPVKYHQFLNKKYFFFSISFNIIIACLLILFIINNKKANR